MLIKHDIATGPLFASLRFFSLSLLLPLTASAMGNDDPQISGLIVDELEYQSSDGEQRTVWDASVYTGWDLHKVWFATEGEHTDGNTEEVELELFYTRAVSAYWDMRAGIRHDSYESVSRNWLQLGAVGLAPYFVETELLLFVGDKGRAGASVELEKELVLTQRWQLLPSMELVVHGHNDPATGAGSGLSTLELGLRLSYRVRREFMPYIGVQWEKAYGQTADYQRAEDENSSETALILGLKAWY